MSICSLFVIYAMKKISLLLFLLCVFITPVFADSSLTLEQFLRGYFSVITQNVAIPNSYTSIVPKFTNIPVKSSLYTLFQKAIYLDAFPNAKMELPLRKNITESQATTIIRRYFPNITIGDQNKLITMDWLVKTSLSLQNMQIQQIPIFAQNATSNDFLSQSELYKDVLDKLHTKYYFQSGLNQTGLLYGAIQGMVKWLNDPYTSFFPPVEANQFEDQIQGEFFGIGAYVDMEQAGIFTITATIEGSPAQKVGLLAQDRIVQVDDHIIDEKVSLNQAVQRVKWPAGTVVSLKYLRAWKLLTTKVTRAKIVVPNIESKVYTGEKNPVCLISLRLFDTHIARDFSKILGTLSSQHCSKYIFDLRNNPGGSLEEVADMLDYFVPSKSPIVAIKSRTDEQVLFAWPTAYPKLTGENIRILMNKGSASASEIFAGVVREYVPGSLLVGTQSYGKWSVQNLESYDDGSLLKYTVAKRYTWKKDVNIDGIWFTPDVKIDDVVGTGKDAILDWALRN